MIQRGQIAIIRKGERTVRRPALIWRPEPESMGDWHWWAMGQALKVRRGQVAESPIGAMLGESFLDEALA